VIDLVKTYPHPEGGEFNAVDGVSFTVEQGEVFGLLGPNGAGKTTTLEIIEGLKNPTSGRSFVLGLDSVADREAMKTRIGVQLQASSYFEFLTLAELLDLFGSFYPAARPPEELLDRVGLLDKRKSLVGELSGGQAQRFSIIAALVNDPDVVFLDEPSTGLDPQARRNVWDLIRSINDEDSSTVILTTHYMEEAELLADRIAIVDRGRVQVVDTPERLIAEQAGAHWVRFTSPTAVPEASLRRLPGATRVDVRTNGSHRYDVATVTPNVTVPALFALAAEEPFGIDDLQVVAPTLEDVFLNVTGRTLRD
jgi:ABC-2 type transport system ATP-binding protein